MPVSLPPQTPAPRLEALGDCAWLVRFDDVLQPGANARVHSCAAWLGRELASDAIELVPAFATLAVHFEPALRERGEVRAAIERALARWQDSDDGDGSRASRVVTIPCCYGGTLGPDLESLADHVGTSADEVVKRHGACEFLVAMIGFQPGFPYLLGLDPSLAMPRLASPRAQVPAGSVAIGGAQCGIYPRVSPGGWRLIGRTPVALFDPHAARPTLLRPGDRVRFRAIAPGEFESATVSIA
jgi:KipI family sensor histidine kinase inhibitor